MSKLLIQQLKALRHKEVNPSPEWLTKNRSLLLSQIKNTVPAERGARIMNLENIWAKLSVYLPQPVVYNFVRPLAVLLIVALVGTSGWIASVDAAYDALPGDGMAYYLKRGLENTQVAVINLVGDQNAQAKVHLKLAASRASELKKISALPPGVVSDNHKKAQVASAVEDLKKEITTINNKIEEVSGNALQAQVIKDVVTDVNQIKTVLQDVRNNLSTSATAEDIILTKAVSETKDAAIDTGVTAVAVLLDKHLSNNADVSKEEVKQAIDNTLQAVTSDVNVSNQTMDGVKTMVQSAQDQINGISKQNSVVSASSTLVSSTKDIVNLVSAAGNLTSDVALQAQVVTNEVDKKITAAKVLTNTGDFSKAVDTIKDVKAAAKVVENLSNTAVEQAQAVLPIVQAVKDSISVPAEVNTSSVSLPIK